jgi:hypothetical protein
MITDIEKNFDKILGFLYNNTKSDKIYFSGSEIQKGTDLEPIEINDAVQLLRENRFIEWHQYLVTAPFVFGSIKITPRGKYEIQRKRSIEKVTERIPTEFRREAIISGGDKEKENEFIKGILSELGKLREIKPLIPIGSPYGFSDKDWEIVTTNRADKKTLYVVLGSKFESPYFNTENLRENVRVMFQKVVDRYNSTYSDENISLKFTPLHAGYGEHLFNQIARDIISSDIAVFETSDLAPNIFLEIGVALTWGSSVFLDKLMLTILKVLLRLSTLGMKKSYF